MNLPKYMIRPDDHMIFSLNEDSFTYSVEDSKKQFPDSLHNKYPYDIMIRAEFFSAPECELDYHRGKQAEYHRNLDRLFQQEKGCGD